MRDDVSGCVYQKSGRYYARVYYYDGGTRKQKSYATGVVVDNSTARKAKQTEKAAQHVLAEILSTFVVPGKHSKEEK